MSHLLLWLALLWTGAAGQPSAELPQGRLLGLERRTSLTARPFSAYLGIPFARPPVNELRFRAPEAAGSWPGVLNATRLPPDCLQYSHLTYHFPYCPVVGSEDCLYLNVYTPQNAGTGLNVVVFLNPGSWMYYSSAYVGPELLLERDFVLVTFNYRLGPFGFLSTGDSVVPGNNGLKDQVLALKWVQSNINAFGGDPTRVTLAGLSSGGASVHFHLLSPASKGLFSRAISVSGTALCPWAIVENVRQKSALIASELGCPTSPSEPMVDCLRSRPGEHIAGLSALFMPWLYNPFSPFGPVVEPPGLQDSFLSKAPAEYLREQPANDVPWLVTFVSDEGLYPGAEILGTNKYVHELDNSWEELLPFVLDYNASTSLKDFVGVAAAVRSHYNIDLTSTEGKKNFIKMLGDRLYLAGISEASKLHARSSAAPVFMYEFAYQTNHTVADLLTKFTLKERLGVCHGDDLLHLFPLPILQGAHKQTTELLLDIWTKFANTGLLDWERSGGEELVWLRIQSPEEMTTLRAASFGDSDFWNSLKLEEGTRPRDEL